MRTKILFDIKLDLQIEGGACVEENSPPQEDFLKVFNPLLRSEMQNSLTNPSVSGIKTKKISRLRRAKFWAQTKF